MSLPQAPTEARGWILYDDSCGFCRRWVPFWQNALRRRGFDLAPLQDDWVQQKIDLPRTELVNDLRLLFANGSHLAGAEVYRYATRHIWWARPIYLFSITPGCRQIFDWSYLTFAKNRHKISDACKLDAPERD